MNTKELADLLNGRNYRDEITNDEERKALENGLVVVFGASDDLMGFRGAIYNEIECNEGGTAYLNKDGLLENECDDCDCPYFEKEKDKAKEINAIWCPDEVKDDNGNIIDYISWDYETDIPHEKFAIIEDEGIYCLGIVFDINNLG